MKKLISLLLVLLVSSYLLLFSFIDEREDNSALFLQVFMPAPLLRAITGYAVQFAAEVKFAETAVYLGSYDKTEDLKKNRYALANNLIAISSLYPEFNDTYFYTQSFLAPLSRESAKEANTVLHRAIKYYPDNMIYRFFYAFNYFEYLDDPLAAAEAFLDASNQDNAPPLFEHLAAVFSAGGGDFKTSLAMLETMLINEDNEAVRERYRGEIECLKKAILIDNALSAYISRNGSAPEKLTDLTPEFLAELPDISGFFELSYEPPEIRLLRP